MTGLNRQPIEVLKNLLPVYSLTIITNYVVCEGLLKDFSGKYKLEINLLSNAVKFGLVEELFNCKNNIPNQVFIQNLISRFRQESGVDIDYAEWTISGWAEVLGIQSGSLLKGKFTQPYHKIANFGKTISINEDKRFKFINPINWTPIIGNKGKISIQFGTPLGIRLSTISDDFIDDLINFISGQNLYTITALDFGANTFFGDNLELSDSQVDKISRLSQLEYLNINNCLFVNDLNLQKISGLHNLKYLNISSCVNITEKGLSFLINLGKIVELDISGCKNLNQGIMPTLSSLPYLEKLSLRDNKWVDNTFLLQLSNLKKMELLDLSDNNSFDDKGLREIQKLDSLRNLLLSNCNHISETGLNGIFCHSNINYLDIRGCNNVLNRKVSQYKQINPNIIVLV
jgi:hypothetical protein